jgi:cytochrome c peroxidase
MPTRLLADRRPSRLLSLLVTTLAIPATSPAESLPNLFPFLNSTGLLETYNTAGGHIDLNGPFFQSLGTNGRSCFSCHRPAQGWGTSADELKLRFLLTDGKDPVFRTNDGSNCGSLADTSTIWGRRKAYSLLLDRGLIRIPIAVPANAEFDVVNVSSRYGCNDASTISVYRRPIPTTNLRFQSAIMWVGRARIHAPHRHPENYLRHQSIRPSGRPGPPVRQRCHHPRTGGRAHHVRSAKGHRRF